MLLERQSKLESIIALLLLRLIALVFELFIAVTSLTLLLQKPSGSFVFLNRSCF